MKPPDHPVPSGDRRMAALLTDALTLAGHEVELASRLRSRDRDGDRRRQERIKAIGAALARRLLRRIKARPSSRRPQAWLTYHLYYKAPDWIGPAVASALEIPYLVAEASIAGKRAGGPWDLGHRATISAIERAATVIALTPVDAECLPTSSRVRSLRPFLDPTPYRAAAAERDSHRAALGHRLGLEDGRCRMAAVAMMRAGDKLDSYRQLAESLRALGDRPWYLIVAGDGPARREVEALFAWAPRGQVHFVGETKLQDLPSLYAACDLLVWPAVNEAYGMALLEAQACGLPVVAGRSGGVPEIVAHGETGLLTAAGDCDAFAVALANLIEDPARRGAMAGAAVAKVEAQHGIASAADQLDAILREAVAGP
jgi:glycosyltransferase involved in cell wall biosynthesis